MIASILSLALFGVATGFPAAGSNDVSPPMEASKGFTLAVHVTNSSERFGKLLQNAFIASYHVGAGHSLVSTTDNPDHARVFYQNGTLQQQAFFQSTIITDGGIPPAPRGLNLQPDTDNADVSTAHLNAGQGQKGFGFTQQGSRTTRLAGGWMACITETVTSDQKPVFLIKNAKVDTKQRFTNKAVLTEKCTQINLVPQCHALEAVQKGAFSTHDHVLQTPCYPDAIKIDE